MPNNLATCEHLYVELGKLNELFASAVRYSPDLQDPVDLAVNLLDWVIDRLQERALVDVRSEA